MLIQDPKYCMSKNVLHGKKFGQDSLYIQYPNPGSQHPPTEAGPSLSCQCWFSRQLLTFHFEVRWRECCEYKGLICYVGFAGPGFSVDRLGKGGCRLRLESA